jgi:hypothetical protein
MLPTKCVMSLRSPTQDENKRISLHQPARTPNFSKENTKETKADTKV